MISIIGGGWDYVANILDFNTDNFYPKDHELYSYIALSNVSASGEIEILKPKLGQNLPSRARRKVKAGEVILSSNRRQFRNISLNWRSPS